MRPPARTAPRRRSRLVGGALLALLVVLVLVAARDRGDGPPPAARPGPAARPAVVLHVAPGAPRRAPCTAGGPCGSLARANAVAPAGAVVELAGGRYPAQRLRAGPERDGPPVTFRPAPGARVVLGGELRIAADHVVVERLQVPGWTVSRRASHVVLRDVDSRGGIYITSASDVSVIGGSVGPGVNYSPEIKAAEGSDVAPRNVLIDGVRFHDWIRDDRVHHVQCLHVMAADGLTIRNSTFERCESFDVFVSLFGEAGTPSHVVIEDNRFSCCRSGYYALMFSATPGALYRDVLVRGNVSDNSFGIGEGSTDAGSDVRFLDNRAPYLNPLFCGLPGVTWDGNRWRSGKPCGPHDTVAGAGP